MKAKLVFFVPALLYTGAILFLSLINLAETPVKELGFSDKILHLIAYFGLAFLWMLVAIDGENSEGLIKRLLIIALSVMAFGIFIEVIQGELTSYRELDFYDIMANGIGAILAGILVWLLKESLIRLKAKIYLIFIKK